MPGYITSKAHLDTLRRRRTVANLMRQLERGDWKGFLLTAKRAAHRYKSIQEHSGKIEPLLVKVNIVRMAIRFHGHVVAGEAVSLSVPEGFEMQKQALNQIRDRSQFDALLMQAVRTANIDAFSTLRVDHQAGLGTVICTDCNRSVLPVGPDGPDMQPTVWERRWIIERDAADKRTKVKYLRVERHSAPGGVGRVEQEIYKAKSDDLFAPLEELAIADLAAVLGDGAPEPLTLTGVPYPLITRLVHEYFDGQPEMLMSEHDFDLLDMHAAALSRWDRSLEMHGHPKVRIGEGNIDEKTGKFHLGDDAIVDPEKLVEYLVSSGNFEAMLDQMNKSLNLLAAQLQLSPALMGFKLDGGATPDTFDKLRLEANNTLARGHVSCRYMAPALGRVFTVASMVDSQLPMRGYAVAPVGVTMHPGLPQSPMDIAREMTELRGSGGADALIDLQTAVEQIHGEQAAPAILERLKQEQAAAVARTQQELMLGFAGGGAA